MSLFFFAIALPPQSRALKPAQPRIPASPTRADEIAATVCRVGNRRTSPLRSRGTFRKRIRLVGKRTPWSGCAIVSAVGAPRHGSNGTNAVPYWIQYLRVRLFECGPKKAKRSPQCGERSGELDRHTWASTGIKRSVPTRPRLCAEAEPLPRRDGSRAASRGCDARGSSPLILRSEGGARSPCSTAPRRQT